ncbi:MAG TPA: pyrroloquinoline quinone biosynthesis protein PqqB [Lichenihabitans sp.]|jgi:pyrroloquinoline quinone biosynthesis protein B|nr:pyrroloquinoline quinone biosynthesis protein PqqB [Lichenihabitans sp.]
MRVLVLGSGAGGGVPQWNCRCPVCSIAWDRPGEVRRRTQTSLALSADDRRWIVLDAAPDLRQQIIDTPALHPAGAGRHSPIEAVVLTSGEVDHVAGLLCLREGHPFSIFATASALDDIASSPIFGVLNPDIVARRVLALDRAVSVAGLAVTPFAVPGKVPLYREGNEVVVGAATEDVVGLEIADDSGHRVAYVPGVAHLSEDLVARLGAADVLFLDGTTFTDDELVASGLSTKTAGRMGHLPIGGEGGSLHRFASGTPTNRVYIHLNNTNPVLIETSPERALVAQAGWEVAHDGMEFVL